MAWSPYRCNDDHKYWSFTRNICNRFIENFKVAFEASSQACSAPVTTIWRPGFMLLTANSAVRRALVMIKTQILKENCNAKTSSFHMKERSKCWRTICMSLESVKSFSSYKALKSGRGITKGESSYFKNF